VVFEAEHTTLRQHVAIKMLLPDFAQVPEFVKRFDHEARAAARLQGPHVARVFDVGSDGVPYMVMEFLQGKDLGRELKERRVLPVAEAVDHILEACMAMAEAHGEGLVHRDLKPANLFLQQKGDRVSLKVLDFGISKSLMGDGGGMTATQSKLGTPAFMSPEQLRSSKYVDHRTDIWALGVILFRSLTGQLPFSGNTTAMTLGIVNDPPKPMPDLPPALVEATLKALSKDVNQRYMSVDDLAEDIAPFGSGQVPFRRQTRSIPPPEALATLDPIPNNPPPSLITPSDQAPTLVAGARPEPPARGSLPVILLAVVGGLLVVAAAAALLLR